MNIRRTLGLSIALAALLAVTVAGAADAKLYARGHWSDSGSFTVCDSYRLDWTNWGHDRLEDATAQTDYQFFYLTIFNNFHTVITNPDTGAWISEGRATEFKEQDARLLYDDVFSYETVDRGTYVVQDSDGNTVFRDRGTVVTSYVYDSLGDSQPGGVYLEDPVELSNTWDQTFDLCAVADDLIG
jgi:hypothetical protein